MRLGLQNVKYLLSRRLTGASNPHHPSDNNKYLFVARKFDSDKNDFNANWIGSTAADIRIKHLAED